MSVLFCLSQEPFFKRRSPIKILYLPQQKARGENSVSTTTLLLFRIITPKLGFPQLLCNTQHIFHKDSTIYSLFYYKKQIFKTNEKKAAETEKVTVSSNWTHTYTYQQYYHTTTDEEHTPLRDLLIGVYFFPYQFSNSLLISCFISILQKHRTTTNDPKEYIHTKVKTRNKIIRRTN